MSVDDLVHARLLFKATFQALDHIDYSQLKYAKFAPAVNKKSETDTKKNPSSLVELSARAIVKDTDRVSHALEALPCFLANTLMREAIKTRSFVSIAVLVSEWPLESLEMRQIHPEGSKSLFEKTMEVDTAIFMGLMRRESVQDKAQKLHTIDLRGYKLNDVFCQVLIGALPLLSIPKEKRNPEDLLKCVMKVLRESGLSIWSADDQTTTELEEGSWPDYDSLGEDLKAVLEKKIFQFTDCFIYVPKGKKICIKVDSLEFSRKSNRYGEYFLMGGLRGLTTCHLETTNLTISTHLNTDERLTDSLAPFISLVGQDPSILQGLKLGNMGDLAFQYLSDVVSKFQHLHALDIGNCSIDITGTTRVRTDLRSRMVNLFSSFSHLGRLDLQKSILSKCLTDLLDALTSPLVYLNLNSCGLDEQDLQYLGNCKHTESLCELHLSGLNKNSFTPQTLLKSLSNFKNLMVLALQNNSINGGDIGHLCDLIGRLPKLRSLDTLFNFLEQEKLLEMVRAAALNRSMQCMTMNMAPVMGNEEQVQTQRRIFSEKCERLLKSQNRKEITLIVLAIGIE